MKAEVMSTGEIKITNDNVAELVAIELSLGLVKKGDTAIVTRVTDSSYGQDDVVLEITTKKRRKR